MARTPASDVNEQHRYLVISEERQYGYFHLYGRITTQRFEDSQWMPYGLSDDYAYNGELLWTGLRVNCQGDITSQRRTDNREIVYGFDCEYHNLSGVGLGKARRMCKTLEHLTRKMDKLSEARGYVKTYGEYCGRIAEALGCKGIAIEKTPKSRHVTGQRWDWMSIGDGVNQINQRIYLWQQEAVEQTTEAAS